MNVQFYQSIDDTLLTRTAVVARKNNQWVFCKSEETYGVPSGPRAPKESILDAASRTLKEKIGPSDFTLIPVCAYSIEKKDSTAYGMLYFAKIESFDCDRENITLLDQLPNVWAEPHVQIPIIEKVRHTGLMRLAG
ncbi:hypothetical protein [Hominifimenecus sp. rT4P-3]|uniref:hypothetical protein n=1 Tax=Hominifimenecus sp. rT4P-3 TaxID=3242979 RepID=UPI003DA601A8